ncbi:MAG TPA: TolC family protein [Gallionella sp.]|nr:TolC family protein [Gallionella sp.]
MNRFIAWCLVGCLLSGFACAAEAPLGADVGGLLSYAREHNPELAAARYEAEAVQQRTESAGALPDPVLRTELMDITNQGTKSASLNPSQVGGTRYLLMQTVPWFGKRGLQRDVAEAQAAQADGQAAATWTELAGQIKTAYANYYYLSRSEQLAQQTLKLLVALEHIAHERYANGLATQQEVIRAQVEQTALRGELIELQNGVHHQHSRLNALLSRPGMAVLAEPAQLRPIPAQARLDYAVLADRLRARNPQLLMADARSNEAVKSRDLTYVNRYPGFTLGVAPTQSGNRVKSWDLMVEMNIPLQQGSRRAQEREADALLSAAESRKQALQDRMLNMLSEGLSGLESARRTEALTTTSLLPQAELTYQSALAGYENGRVGFAMLLEAQQQILKAKQQRLKAQLDAQLRLAEIENLLGEEL